MRSGRKLTSGKNFPISETIGILTAFQKCWLLITLVSFTGAPLVVYPLVRLGQRVRRSTRRSQEQLEHLSHLTAEAFAGHRIVKAFGAEDREDHRFRDASQRLYRTNMKITSTVALLPGSFAR